MSTEPANTSDSTSAETPARPRMLVSVAWVLGFRILDRIAGIGSVMVLARLLVPEHFGLVSLGASVVAFVELLGALSLDAVLIQKQNATRADFDTAWTIQVCIASLCAGILTTIAPHVADFFRQPDLRVVILVLAAAMFVDGFTNIRIIEFRKHMRFDREFVFLATKRLTTTAITITSAFILRNHWALVIGIASGKTIGLVLSYIMRPYMPRFTLESKNELLHASWWLFFANGVLFVRQRLSDFVLGRTTSTRVVGSFNLANEMSSIVSIEVVAPVNRVALPEFSSIGNPAGIVQRFNQLTGQLAIFLIPMGVGLAACAKPLVHVFFGANWEVAADVLSVLAFAGMVAGLGSNMGVALLAVGRFKDNALVQAASAALLIPSLLAGAMVASYHGAAHAMLWANVFSVVLGMYMLNRALQYPPLDFLSCIWRPSLCAALMFLTVRFIGFHPEWFWRPARVPLQLTAMVGVGMIVYISLMALLFVTRGRRDVPELTTLGFLRTVWTKARSKLRGAEA